MLMVSIIGDSISTYSGYNPKGYAVFYDDINQRKNGLTSVYDTWWAKVNQSLHAYLCVNNSYSGSKVSGCAFPSANCKERTSSLHTKECKPNIILVYIGYNDFGKGIKIKSGLFDNNKDQFFYDMYLKMVQSIKQNYPSSTIICGTLMRGYVKNSNWIFPESYAGIPFDNYNAAIRKAAKKAGVKIADLTSFPDRYETLDGSHPTAKGHLTIAKAWIYCLKDMNLVD